MKSEYELKDKFKRPVQIGDVMISSNGQRYIVRTEQKFFAFDYDISALVRTVLEISGEDKVVDNDVIAYLMGLYK